MTVTLDATALNQLEAQIGRGREVEVCDESGRPRFTVVAQPAMTLQEMEAYFTPEELAEAMEDDEPGIPFDEIFRLFGERDVRH